MAKVEASKSLPNWAGAAGGDAGGAERPGHADHHRRSGRSAADRGGGADPDRRRIPGPAVHGGRRGGLAGARARDRHADRGREPRLRQGEPSIWVSRQCLWQPVAASTSA